MKTRTYGLILLGLVGVLPLVVFGYFAVQRSEETAVAEVRVGNDRIAEVIAGRIDAYVRSERSLLATIGTAAVFAPKDRAQLLLDGYSLTHSHLHDLAVYKVPARVRRGGLSPAAGGAAAPRAELFVGRTTSEAYDELAARGAAGESALSKVRRALPEQSGGFAHTMTVAEPIVIAGRREGVIVAQVDLVGLWPPINAARVGSHGFVRLVSGDGELLAHGNPEERRFVFSADPARELALIDAAHADGLAVNQQGQRVVASAASVAGTDWVVTIEQPVIAAYAAARALRTTLWWMVAAALVVAVGIGLIIGRRLVQPLERLRTYTRVLAQGNLNERCDPQTGLMELRDLADSLNDMALSLDRLQKEARSRERLTTFARIAAGLAHDLRLPIEAVRGACLAVLEHPGDEDAIALMRSVSKRDLPRLKEFVDDLRMLSRQGVAEMETTQIDAAGLVRELAESLSTYAKWRGVAFTGEGEAPAVRANPKLLRRALFNLAANAADACLEQGPGGVVALKVSGARDGGARFEVIDDGTGIPENRASELLSGDFESTKRTSGIGLGLGVARHVARAHGGRLELESELGVGTTFSLTLPLNGAAREFHGEGIAMEGRQDERAQADAC